LSDASAKPSLKTAVDREKIAFDCRQLYFRFVVILPPEFETAKFITNIGITPKSNENSELKKKNAAKRQNWIEFNRKWRDYMQTLLFPVYRRIRREIEIPESRINTGIICKVN